MTHSFQNRIHRILILVAIVALWGGAFRGSLAIAELDLGYAEGLCGAWGCLPQTAPLLSVHAMWLTLILGGAWLARLAVPLLRSPGPWLGMTCAATLATLVLLGFDAHMYFENGGAVADVGRRAIFCIITWTDLPLMQMIATCSLNWLAAVYSASRTPAPSNASTCERLASTLQP